MQNLLGKYILTLTSVAITFVLELIANFYLQLSQNEQFIILAIGVLASFIIMTIEREVPQVISSLLDQKFLEITKGFELYHTVTSIDDVDLQNEVFDLAQGLSIGEIPPQIAELRSRRLIKSVQRSLHASDYSRYTEDLLNWWRSSAGNSWYQHNLEAIRRGVKVERHFILYRSDIVSDGAWNEDVVSLLLRQATDEIQVRVVWVEEVEEYSKLGSKSILADFVIFDREEVNVGSLYEIRMYRRPSEQVTLYCDMFDEQKEYAHALEEILPNA